MNIVLSDFEGPFDLLLHLIKKNKMDIYDIKIHQITAQYIDFIRKMKEMDLEVTSEFIVVAATLIEIKSNELLPKIKSNEEEETPENIQKKLLNRLIEYSKFKNIASFFEKRMRKTGRVFTKLPEIIEDNSFLDNNDIFKDVDIVSLYKLYLSILSRYEEKMNIENKIEKEIPIDMFKVEDKMDTIRTIFTERQSLKFSQIHMTTNNKMEKVVTFLAILELIRLREAKVYQDDNFNEIFIERVEDDE